MPNTNPPTSNKKEFQRKLDLAKNRSEERRVGKECRSRRSPQHEKKKKKNKKKKKKEEKGDGNSIQSGEI